MMISTPIIAVMSVGLSGLGEWNGFGGSVASFAHPNADRRFAAIGAPGGSAVSESSGSVYVYENESKLKAVIKGATSGDRFGFAVAPVQDQDNDDMPDLFITATQAGASHDSRKAGYAVVAYSRDWTLSKPVKGDADRDQFGYSCASTGVGTWNHDAEIAVGAPQAFWSQEMGVVHSGPGYVSVRTLPSLLERIRLRGESAKDMFGYSVAIAGDLNADGIPDVVVGSPGASGGGAYRGRVSVWSGKDGKKIRIHEGLLDNDLMGTRVCSVGDLDHDGVIDYAASSGCAAMGLRASVHRGLVSVFSGRTGDLLFEAADPDTEAVNGGFGLSLAYSEGSAGTVSVVVGAPLASIDHFSDGGGMVYELSVKGKPQREIVLGKGDCESMTHNPTTCGPEGFGFALCRYPDMDHDEVSELLIGTLDFFAGGAAFVVSSKSGQVLARIREP